MVRRAIKYHASSTNEQEYSMKNMSSFLILLTLLISGCGYTTSSSIDESRRPGDKYVMFISEYCSGENEKISILTSRTQADPQTISIDGQEYLRCPGDARKRISFTED